MRLLAYRKDKDLNRSRSGSTHTHLPGHTIDAASKDVLGAFVDAGVGGGGGSGDRALARSQGSVVARAVAMLPASPYTAVPPPPWLTNASTVQVEFAMACSWTNSAVCKRAGAGGTT